jgi:hypothetical protein
LLIDIFSSHDKPDIVRPSKAAPDNMRRGDIKNEGREDLENVLVYADNGYLQSGLGDVGDDTQELNLPYLWNESLVEIAQKREPAKRSCPADQQRFFTNISLYQWIADQARTDVNYIMALSAHESGWNGPHSQELHNLFGTTKAGGRNLSYPSYKAAANSWVNNYASWVRGASTINQFVDKLLNHVPPYNINRYGDYRTAIVGGQFKNPALKGARTIGTYQSVLYFKGVCGVAQ